MTALPLSERTAWSDPPTVGEVHQQVLDVLTRHGLARPDAAHVRLPQLRPDSVGWAQSVLLVSCADVERRVVWLDTECIHGPGDFTALVRRFAAATGGHWRPEHLEESWFPLPGGGHRVTITFDLPGRPRPGPGPARASRQVRWEVTTAGDWLPGEFIDHVVEFAIAGLPGRFLDVPSSGQEYVVIYLPAAVVVELEQALIWPSAQDLVEAVHRAASLRPNLPEPWHGIQVPVARTCAQLGLTPQVGAPTVDGVLPLHEAARLGLAAAVDDLLRWGADPHQRDGNGRTAVELAATPAIRHQLAR